MDEDMHSVGERCHFDNNYGTVRYVGKVDGTDGMIIDSWISFY